MSDSQKDGPIRDAPPIYPLGFGVGGLSDGMAVLDFTYPYFDGTKQKSCFTAVMTLDMVIEIRDSLSAYIENEKVNAPK